MEIKLEIPEYDKRLGLQSHWEDSSEIVVKRTNTEVVISANKAGLISLAVQLLTLAQDVVPLDKHIHLDHYTGLEENSIELILEKHES